MATYMLYINSAIIPVVYSPYLNDPSLRITDCGGQPIFQSSLWKQLMNIDNKPASKIESPAAKEKDNSIEVRQTNIPAKKRQRRFPRSLARLLEITARQDFLYQQQLSFNRLRALKKQAEPTLPFQLNKEGEQPDSPTVQQSLFPTEPASLMSEKGSRKENEGSQNLIEPDSKATSAISDKPAEAQDMPMTNDTEMASSSVMNEKTVKTTVASGFRIGDKLSISYGSAKIGEGQFIQAGTDYLVWEFEGDMRVQYIGDGIHLEKL